MVKYNSQFMKRAIELSLESVHTGGGPFGAVIVKDNKIIAEGNNRVTIKNDPTAHAEMVAIRRACRKLNNFQLEAYSLYSTCEPCPMCLGAIYWARVDTVYFAATQADAATVGFDDSFIYEELKLPIEMRKIPFIKVSSDDVIRVLDEWQDKNDKIKY